MVAQIKRQSNETPAQREDRMLQLAMLKNTQAERVNCPMPNLYRVWSDGTPAGTRYLTDGRICTCPWNHEHDSQPDAMCSHMAYVRFWKLG